MPALFHEIFHYLPARWLGLRPRIDPSWQSTRYTRAQNWQRMIVLLPPFVVSFLTLTASLLLSGAQLIEPFRWGSLPYLLNILFWVFLTASCVGDLYKVLYFILFRRWPDRKDAIHA